MDWFEGIRDWLGRLCSVLLPCYFTVSRRIPCNIEQAISLVNRRRTRGGQDTLLTITLPLLTSAKNPSEWTVTSACIGERFFKGGDLCLCRRVPCCRDFLTIWKAKRMHRGSNVLECRVDFQVLAVPREHVPSTTVFDGFVLYWSLAVACFPRRRRQRYTSPKYLHNVSSLL